MARYIGPTCKLARREGADLSLKSPARAVDSKRVQQFLRPCSLLCVRTTGEMQEGVIDAANHRPASRKLSTREGTRDVIVE